MTEDAIKYHTIQFLTKNYKPLTSTTFLVIERDGEYATTANKLTVIKKICKIDLAGANDIHHCK